ncbi:hypothetical protein GCM10018782_65360 [Streptomyces griseoaurantiacus]|nr:hypothetical protein GCM10018782_65360 [Streptomyces griseoaurantiacus]
MQNLPHRLEFMLRIWLHLHLGSFMRSFTPGRSPCVGYTDPRRVYVTVRNPYRNY